MSSLTLPFPTFPYARRTNSETWSPRVDVTETATGYVFHAELPGVNPDDIEVTLDKDVLSVKGKKAIEAKDDVEGYHARERLSGPFERRFRLPEHADGEGITARTENGVLEIVVPKAAPHHPQRIAIAS